MIYPKGGAEWVDKSKAKLVNIRLCFIMLALNCC